MESKILKAFEEFKHVEGIAYCVLDTDEFGDCMSCVNDELSIMYGRKSNGIYLKHWLRGTNKGDAIDKLSHVFIAHDLTDSQGEAFIEIFSKYFDVEPKVYNPTKSFILSERGE